jgi:hypothetical protein
MPPTQAKAPENQRVNGRPVRRFILRLLIFITIAFLIGTALNRLAGQVGADDAARPAGFGRGMAQGALMPLALPNLLAGRDVMIYAPHNTGRTYKLGYTVGVNGCGALFFGIFFWRLSRLRKRLAAVRGADV